MTIKAEIIPPNEHLKRTHYRLLEDLKVLDHIIPAGFISDGATTPRILWAIFPPIADYAEAAFLHDFLLEDGHRAFAHDEFYRALKALGIGKTRSWLMYRGVQIYWDVKTFLLK